MNLEENPHARFGINKRGERLFQGRWHTSGSIQKYPEPFARVMSFVDILASKLEQYNLFLLQPGIPPFPNFSYKLTLLPNESFLLVLGTSPLEREVVLADESRTDAPLALDDEIARCEQDLGWVDCRGFVIPRQEGTSDEQREYFWGCIIEPYAETKAAEIAEEVRNPGKRLLTKAYEVQCQLEISLKHLIEGKLQALHGPNWWKRSIPEAVRTACEERKLKSEGPTDQAHHPLHYAYVDDYKAIIIRADNWDGVFQDIFGNKLEVEGNFLRMNRVRNAIAHARPISEDEYQLFAAAAKWLQIAIDRGMSRGS